MSAVAKPKLSARTAPRGPLQWRDLVEWLSEDAVISPEEARRTIARCSQAESAQHPLVRLASVSMRRAEDQRALDVEMLTEWLAGRTGLAYLLFFRLIAHVGPAQAIAVTYLIPAFAIAWGWLFLGEKATPAMLAGCAVVLAGTALASGFVSFSGGGRR